MDQPANPDFLSDITGALDWWREAGVDCDFSDQPRTWLAPPEPAPGERPAPERRPVRTEPQPAAAPAIDIAALPADPEAFRAWWLAEPLLDEAGGLARIAPTGPVGAPLMVLVEEPEESDRETLLGGPQGQLLDAMLAAFGYTRDQVYLASALPRHTPAADWAEMRQRGLGQVLMHQVAMVRPERVLVLGGNILPLIGHELPHPSAVLSQFNQEGGQEGQTTPVLASWGLPALLLQPRAKAILWKNWLEWTAA